MCWIIILVMHVTLCAIKLCITWRTFYLQFLDMALDIKVWRNLMNIEKWINLDTEHVNDLCCDILFWIMDVYVWKNWSC